MGAWGVRAFDNDDANDWAHDLDGVSDLSLAESMQRAPVTSTKLRPATPWQPARSSHACAGAPATRTHTPKRSISGSLPTESIRQPS
jgi:hypothetical protein